MVDFITQDEDTPRIADGDVMNALRAFAASRSGSGLRDGRENLADARFITYKIVDDIDGKLKRCTRLACNFWNLFVQPNTPVVIRIGTFDAPDGVIAQAWYPELRNGITYGQVEFSRVLLAQYSEFEIAGTIVHEIGHVLGFGWDIWDGLFSKRSGKFNAAAISRLEGLSGMEVETEGAPETIYSHWDEDKFGGELMTGYKGSIVDDRYVAAEHVLPITIDILELLGHRVIRRLAEVENLDNLLRRASLVRFSRQQIAKSIDLDFKVTTEIMETIPHPEKKE